MTFEENDSGNRLTERFAREARDFSDLQNEIAGRDVGRISRFLADGVKSADTSGKARQEHAEALTRLQLALLNDPAYDALYQETAQTLNDAQSRLDALLERVQHEIKTAHLTLEDRRNHAARLEDGTRVYLDKDGTVRSEDGQIIDVARAEGIIWTGTEPTYDSIKAARQRSERLKGIEQDIRSGQAEIGGMQSDLKDEDNPKSAEELEDDKMRADKIVDSIEESLDAEMQTSDSAPSISEQSSEVVTKLVVPEL